MTIHQPAEDQVIPPPSELIDTPALAAMLCVSETSVRRLVDSGKVPGVVRLGRSVRYRRSIIAKWLDTNCLVQVAPSAKKGGRS
jgi:predicted DNA-binding transcriptional regulator AlpA